MGDISKTKNEVTKAILRTAADVVANLAKD